VMAALLATWIWVTSGVMINARGVIFPGTLEAYWKLDENRGQIAEDSSGHRLYGRFRNEPVRVAGVIGGAVMFNGTSDYIDVGQTTPLRLLGSMTVSTWIKPSLFPVDDAAIVSSHNGVGYQLDTTVDRGPRTIGFKLADQCGNPMARYGATRLTTNAWYHVAGVYDAHARTLHVYLNGQLDDGFLLGTVTDTQRSSRGSVYIGRRSDSENLTSLA